MSRTVDVILGELIDADVALDAARAQVRALEAEAADAMKAAGEKHHDTAVGTFERVGRVRRTGWRWDDLVARVVARTADEPGNLFDPDTGEALPPAVIAANVADEIVACLSLSAGKVRALKARGLDPDSFCETDFDGWSIRRPPQGKPEEDQ